MNRNPDEPTYDIIPKIEEEIKEEITEPQLQSIVLTNAPTVKKTREKKEKVLPVLALPVVTAPPEPAPVVEKKRGGRKKKGEE